MNNNKKTRHNSPEYKLRTAKTVKSGRADRSERTLKRAKTAPAAEKCIIKIDRLGVNGEGIGKNGKSKIYVPYALPGEKVEVQLAEAKNGQLTGKIIRIIEKNPQRIEPQCPIYSKCGGCQLQHLSYEGQLEAKRQQVVDELRHSFKGKEIKVLPTIGAANPWNYRNKMQFPVGKKAGKVVLGCFAQGSHEIIDTKNCYIQNKLNNDIANAMREIITKLGISIYDEDRHTGVLRHVVGRVGCSGESMITLVTAVPDLRSSRDIVRMLRDRIPKLVSIQQNIQTYRNNVIMGRDTKVLWGKPTITDKLGKLTFHISPRSFFQINTEQAAVLYNKALEYAGLTGNETVIDAYCGTGTITLFLARKASKVYGIEIVKPAILDAQKNARDNNIKNAEFMVGDATIVMPRLYNRGVEPDVIVVDPPRAGCTPKVLETFANMQPKRIVYVSCDPSTLARDMAIMDRLGYKAEKVQPVDMFCQTGHVETVVLMSKVQK